MVSRISADLEFRPNRPTSLPDSRRLARGSFEALCTTDTSSPLPAGPCALEPRRIVEARPAPVSVPPIGSQRRGRRPHVEHSGAQEARLPQRIRTAIYAPDLGNLDELRATGVTHVAVHGHVSSRFFAPLQTLVPGQHARYERRPSFHTRLFDGAALIWSVSFGTVYALQPELRVYRLADVTSSSNS